MCIDIFLLVYLSQFCWINGNEILIWIIFLILQIKKNLIVNNNLINMSNGYYYQESVDK